MQRNAADGALQIIIPRKAGLFTKPSKLIPRIKKTPGCLPQT
jgi:hypothetical protein